jgi:hypothetical protein
MKKVFMIVGFDAEVAVVAADEIEAKILAGLESSATCTEVDLNESAVLMRHTDPDPADSRWGD